MFKFGGFFPATKRSFQNLGTGHPPAFQGRETYGEALWAKIQEERHGTSVQISGAQTTGFFRGIFFWRFIWIFSHWNGTLYLEAIKLFLQMYGDFWGISHIVVHCLGWCHIMTTVFWYLVSLQGTRNISHQTFSSRKNHGLKSTSWEGIC